MKVIQLKREECDNQRRRLSMLILKSYATQGTLCYTTLTHNVTVLIATFIAFHILHYFGTNRKRNKKKKYVAWCVRRRTVLFRSPL